MFRSFGSDRGQKPASEYVPCNFSSKLGRRPQILNNIILGRGRLDLCPRVRKAWRGKVQLVPKIDQLFLFVRGLLEQHIACFRIMFFEIGGILR